MTKLQQKILTNLIAYLAILLAAMISRQNASALAVNTTTKVSSCADVMFVFARGSRSGEVESTDTAAWRQSFEALPELKSLNIDFYNLGDRMYGGAQYPAAEIGFSSFKSFDTTISALIQEEKTGTFNKSVTEGTKELVNYIEKISTYCRDTKFVLGGYSQGALVLHRAFEKIDPEKIIFAATFGDPKLYLPEGTGNNPPACRNEYFSDYRIYAPNCRAHSGILGVSNPYMPESFKSKVGLWCNAHDIMCSNYIDLHDLIGDHVAYTSNGVYAQAAQYILQKIAKTFPEKLSDTAEIRPLHARDTAFLIDTTGSMAGAIKKYREEAIKTAEETVRNGGRIALFEFRDLSEDGREYVPHQLCDFSCTIDDFTERVNNLKVSGGGDSPESALSASFGTMTKLGWQKGATKSIVVLTDAAFHNPDKDGITLEEVVEKSLEIDPVVFYVITKQSNKESYAELTNRTGGRVFDIDTDEINLSTTILTSTDDLSYTFDPTPGLIEPSITSITINTDKNGVEASTKKNNTKSILVFLDDYFIGSTSENTFKLSNLPDGEHTLTVSPISEDGYRGESMSKTFIIGVDSKTTSDNNSLITETRNTQNSSQTTKKIIPNAPNTGTIIK